MPTLTRTPTTLLIYHRERIIPATELLEVLKARRLRPGIMTPGMDFGDGITPPKGARHHTPSSTSHTVEHEAKGVWEVNPETGKTVPPGGFKPKAGTVQTKETKARTERAKAATASMFNLAPNWQQAAQTPTLHAAVSYLAGLCDGAIEQDGMGYNQGDSHLGKRLAMADESEWTDEEKSAAHKMLQKYKGQLADGGIDVTKIPKPKVPGYFKVARGERTFEEGAPKGSVIVGMEDASHLRVSFGYDPKLVSAVKTITGRQYDGANKRWIIPLSSAGQLTAAFPSFQLTEKAAALIDGADTARAATLEKAQVEAAQLSDEDRDFKSNVLGLSKEEVQAHPKLNAFQKGFLLGSNGFYGNLGKAVSELSNKQLPIYQEMQGVHDRYLAENPAKKAEYRKSFEARNAEKVERIRKIREGDARALELKGESLRAKDDHDYTLPDHPNRKMLTNGDLFEHQKAGANWLLKQKKGILAFLMGLGKTNCCLAAFETLREEGKAKKMLWVVPKARLYGTEDDINDLFPGRKIVVIDGTAAEREKQKELAKDADYVICTYDMLRREGDNLRDLKPEVVAFDECVRIKGKDSQVALSARENFKDLPYVWYVSATPIPNSPDDLFNLMKGIDPKLFGSYTKFQQDHCNLVWNKFKGPRGGWDIKGYKNLKKTSEVVAPCFMYRNYSSPDVNIDMPPKIDTTQELDMGTEQAKVYNSLRLELLDEAENMTERSFESGMALTNLLRLEQVSISPRLLDPAWRGSEPKLEATANLIQDQFNSGSSQAAVVFSHFIGTQPIMKEYLLATGIKESEIAEITGDHYSVGGKKVKRAQDVVNAMNSGQVKVLLGSDAAAEGLNLQRKANLLIHLDCPWRPDISSQREFRIYRPGQRNKVLIVDMKMKNAVEDLKRSTAKGKAAAMEAILSEQDPVEPPKLTYQDYLAALRQEA